MLFCIKWICQKDIGKGIRLRNDLTLKVLFIKESQNNLGRVHWKGRFMSHRMRCMEDTERRKKINIKMDLSKGHWKRIVIKDRL